MADFKKKTQQEEMQEALRQATRAAQHGDIWTARKIAEQYSGKKLTYTENGVQKSLSRVLNMKRQQAVSAFVNTKDKNQLITSRNFAQEQFKEYQDEIKGQTGWKGYGTKKTAKNEYKAYKKILKEEIKKYRKDVDVKKVMDETYGYVERKYKSEHPESGRSAMRSGGGLRITSALGMINNAIKQYGGGYFYHKEAENGGFIDYMKRLGQGVFSMYTTAADVSKGIEDFSQQMGMWESTGYSSKAGLYRRLGIQMGDSSQVALKKAMKAKRERGISEEAFTAELSQVGLLDLYKSQKDKSTGDYIAGGSSIASHALALGGAGGLTLAGKKIFGKLNPFKKGETPKETPKSKEKGKGKGKGKGKEKNKIPTAKEVGKLGKVAKIAGKAVPALNLAYGIYDQADNIKKSRYATSILGATGSVLGGLGGATVGSVAGLGGTIAGGVAGYEGGKFIGEKIGGLIDDFMGNGEQQQSTSGEDGYKKIDIEIKVNRNEFERTMLSVVNERISRINLSNSY